MTALLGAALGAMVGVGVLLIIQGIRGRPVLPRGRDGIPAAFRSTALWGWVSAGAVAALLVYAVTGWLVASVAAGVLVAVAPRFVGGRSERQVFIARTEAVAAWTEMIRDTMAGAAGLEQALIASAAVAPAAIGDEVDRFTARLDRMPLTDALARLGDDLAHPSADLVVVSLANAARMEARELGPLLTRLAESIRGDVKMRLRVEVGRARIRTSARIVVITTIVTTLIVYLFSSNLLEAYDTAAGQAWLLVVFAVFALGAWMLHSYGRLEMPERFRARQRTTP